MEDEIEEKIYVKQSITWNVIDYMLDYIRTVGNVLSDKEFAKSFEEMRKVVDKKLETPTDYRVEDIFVVVEQIKGKY